MKPFISVVIPAYNKSRFIGKTLDSIITQNYSGVEVIIEDGGSTDGTLKIIEKYAGKYPDIIRYESKKDKGQWDAINKGFKKAKGKIIAYINADDVYTSGAFAEIERLYRLNIDALWFAGRGDVIDAKGEKIAVWPTRYKNLLLTINDYSLLLVVNYLMQPSVFITKTAWRRFGPFTGVKNFVMEYDLWLKIAKIKMPITTAKYLSSFRLEPSTITKNSSDLLLKEDEKIL
jgi:glycosyltransferase involved in cell wall biosynthesis